MSAGPGLIADIGGTNARFALADHRGGWSDELSLRCADFAGPAEAVRAYLEAVRPPAPPTTGAFCVASPVLADTITLTNNPWQFSVDGTRRALRLERLRVVNDFVANALACPRLHPPDWMQVGGGVAQAGFPIAALGPGTGLGVALLVPCDGVWQPVATEGGHATLPATTDREADVLAAARAILAPTGDTHVSGERLVSGPGLALLHATLCRMAGRACAALTPAEVTEAALAGTDSQAVEALDLFFGFLGSLAGNLALTTGALGGVFILGGIVPRMLEPFALSRFRDQFEAKGRFSGYLKGIPTMAVTHPYPAFLGLQGLTDP
ncbi:MAG: glucokinase [Rhodospirillaceae bacterium]